MIMATIIANTRKHATSAAVLADMRSVEQEGTGTITDATALAVAGWYQSPTGHGHVFARFASTGVVADHSEMIAAVDAELALGQDKYGVRCLRHLRAWADLTRRAVDDALTSREAVTDRDGDTRVCVLDTGHMGPFAAVLAHLRVLAHTFHVTMPADYVPIVEAYRAEEVYRAHPGSEGIATADEYLDAFEGMLSEVTWDEIIPGVYVDVTSEGLFLVREAQGTRPPRRTRRPSPSV